MSSEETTAMSPQNSFAQQYVKAEDFRAFVEAEVLKVIKILIEAGETPQERIQEIARNSLMLLPPGLAIDEIYRQAVKLDDNCPELAPVVIKLMREYEEKYAKKALAEISHLVSLGKYDDAQTMVQKVLMYKILQ